MMSCCVLRLYINLCGLMCSKAHDKMLILQKKILYLMHLKRHQCVKTPACWIYCWILYSCAYVTWLPVAFICCMCTLWWDAFAVTGVFLYACWTPYVYLLCSLFEFKKQCYCFIQNALKASNLEILIKVFSLASSVTFPQHNMSRPNLRIFVYVLVVGCSLFDWKRL